MTEDEAKKKWCPMVRTIALDLVPSKLWSNRGGQGSPATCIASECMMWEWSPDKELQDKSRVIPTGDCGLKR